MQLLLAFGFDIATRKLLEMSSKMVYRDTSFLYNAKRGRKVSDIRIRYYRKTTAPILNTSDQFGENSRSIVIVVSSPT